MRGVVVRLQHMDMTRDAWVEVFTLEFRLEILQSGHQLLVILFRHFLEALFQKLFHRADVRTVFAGLVQSGQMQQPFLCIFGCS